MAVAIRLRGVSAVGVSKAAVAGGEGCNPRRVGALCGMRLRRSAEGEALEKQQNGKEPKNAPQRPVLDGKQEMFNKRGVTAT